MSAYIIIVIVWDNNQVGCEEFGHKCLVKPNTQQCKRINTIYTTKNNQIKKKERKEQNGKT